MNNPDQDAGADGSVGPECDPAADTDGDCIPDGVEGCTDAVVRDADNDGFPNWEDPDSDNDGIGDEIEVGPDCNAPRDSDADGAADYEDFDSDNDGAPDQFEDRNGDGMVGECTTACNGNEDCEELAGELCSQPVLGGPGVCVSVACLGGETDPRNNDTDLDGVPDGLEGNFICNPQDEENPDGVRRIVYADSVDTAYADTDWRVALPVGVLEGEPAINAPTGLEAVYTFDMPDPASHVAGFLVSRAPFSTAATTSALEESQLLISAVQSTAAVASVTTRVSGTNITSLDGFDTVVSATFEVNTSSPISVTELRQRLIPALLGRPATDVTFPPPGWTAPTDISFILVVQTVYRELTDQTVVMGALSRRIDYDDRNRLTSINADDLANGTGHSVSGNGEAIECEQFIADKQAAADIIWIVDESGSVSDDRQRIANAANGFFQAAVAAGLDFRMGVTDMNDTGPGGQPGIFATRQAGGTGDRWLLSFESAPFSANIEDPSGPDSADGAIEHGMVQGRSAINRHTPRSNADPQMVRVRTKLVVIYVTDEAAQSIKDEGLMPGNPPSPAGLAAIKAYTDANFTPQLVDEGAVAHLIGHPPPLEQSSCTFEPSYGYYDLVNATGGQIGSICQNDLSATIDAIIDSIISDASPIVLSLFPISASISVARDNVAVPRSRATGWDYRGAANSIIFFNLPFDPANPSDIVVSYRRWAEQVPIE